MIRALVRGRRKRHRDSPEEPTVLQRIERQQRSLIYLAATARTGLAPARRRGLRLPQKPSKTCLDKRNRFLPRRAPPFWRPWKPLQAPRGEVARRWPLD